MTERHLLMLLLTLGLAACVPVRDQGLPPASTIELHQGLTVPAGHTRVFLQAGAVVAKTRLNTYLPHCNLELRQVAEVPVVIDPDTFTIGGVSEGEESVVSRGIQRYAARLRLVDDSITPSMVSRYLHYRLSSPRQPQVMRFTCHGGMDFPGRALAPTLAEMRRAVGSYLTLQPAQ